MKSEERLRYEIGKCGRCEICRELVEGSCLFFPEMFRLVDAERDTGREISTESLFRLVGLCNFCGICPCRDIRDAILAFKTGYMDRNGLGFRVRMLESVQTVGKVGGTCPGVANFLLQNGATGGIVKNMLGIHRDCGFPLFPVAGFPRWMKDRENGRPLTGGEKGKVAYFTGCTARYFFPEVARAVVEVLEKNGAEVHIPEQQCCGMPSMLEGDRNKTLELAKANVDLLTGLIDRGYDIVTSCPTCGYMLKVLLRAGAENAGKQLNVRDRENGFVEIDIEKDHMELKPVPGGGHL